MDTEGVTESVHINGPSMLSGLKLGECKSFHARKKQTVCNNEIFTV